MSNRYAFRMAIGNGKIVAKTVKYPSILLLKIFSVTFAFIFVAGIVFI
jgi:hypothetical protein